MDERLSNGVPCEWRYGFCYPMALALGEMLGCRFATLTVTVVEWGRERRHVVHAWAVSSDGRWFDAGGDICEDFLRETFLNRSSRKFSDEEFGIHENVDDFLAQMRSSCPEREWEMAKEWLDSMLPRARQVAEEHFSHLLEGMAPTL